MKIEDNNLIIIDDQKNNENERCIRIEGCNYQGDFYYVLLNYKEIKLLKMFLDNVDLEKMNE